MNFKTLIFSHFLVSNISTDTLAFLRYGEPTETFSPFSSKTDKTVSIFILSHFSHSILSTIILSHLVTIY